MSLPWYAFSLLLLQTSAPQESEFTSAARASRARTSFASVALRRGPRHDDDAGALPLPPEGAEEHTMGSSSSSGEEPLPPAAVAAAPAPAPPAAAAPAPLPPPLRSFEDGVFAAPVAVVAARSESAALLSLAETEGDADGLMLQVLLLLLPPAPIPTPSPPPRCGVECPESGMEQEGGAEFEELGASGGRRRLDEEAATPGCCCCCEEGDADVVVVDVEVEASMLSIPPLLAPRLCVAVVAVPIRQDAEPPSEEVE